MREIGQFTSRKCVQYTSQNIETPPTQFGNIKFAIEMNRLDTQTFTKGSSTMTFSLFETVLVKKIYEYTRQALHNLKFNQNLTVRWFGEFIDRKVFITFALQYHYFYVTVI